MIDAVIPPHYSNRPTLHPISDCLSQQPFEAPVALRNGHAMTIFTSLWPRRFAAAWPQEARFFQTEPETRVLTFCHWQTERRKHPTLLLVHGLEGHAERGYMLGTAEKAWRAGFNVIRQNVRNCGDTEHLTPTLYHSGLTSDLRAIVRELIDTDRLPEIFIAGFSMGGNQALKFAGELGADAPPQLRGVAAISPAIDLAACCDAIARPQCRLYEERFLRSLKVRVRRKAQLFPGTLDPDRVDRVRSLREFDDVVTGPFWGFGDADGYYANASSRPFLRQIRVPALMITAQDDPFIPYEPFTDAEIAANEHLLLLAPRHGGHVGFLARQRGRLQDEDRYWAEGRAVEFCRLLSQFRVI
ncbi:MAG: alpha/beta fold hydrolase [Blastocatellia bacterium]